MSQQPPPQPPHSPQPAPQPDQGQPPAPPTPGAPGGPQGPPTGQQPPTPQPGGTPPPLKKKWLGKTEKIVIGSCIGFAALILIIAVPVAIVSSSDVKISPAPTHASTPSVPTTGADPGKTLTREQGGDDEWPLTVDEVEFICREPGQLFVKADGTLYTLNGTAKGNNPDMPNVVEIWRDDPENKGLKIYIGPVLNTGLEYCGRD